MNQPNSAPAFVYVIAGVFAFVILLSAYRRREAIGHKLRHLFFGVGAFLLTILIMHRFTQDAVKVMLAAVLAEVVVMSYTRPTRSRYISRAEKRKVIARYERRTGQRYDSRKHHIDHIVPYSRGGGSTADNLRVLESEKNLAKSARSPWWDVFSRR